MNIQIARQSAGFVFPAGWLERANGVPPPSRKDGLSNPTVQVSTASRALGLGDAVELVAKPIGCWLDRVTARLPWQLVKPRLPKGKILITIRRPKWQRWLLDHRLPETFRTQFCVGRCGCSKRKRWLNQLVPDLLPRFSGPPFPTV